MILGVENYENTHKITYNYEKKIGVQKNDQKCPDPNYIQKQNQKQNQTKTKTKPKTKLKPKTKTKTQPKQNQKQKTTTITKFNFKPNLKICT